MKFILFTVIALGFNLVQAGEHCKGLGLDKKFYAIQLSDKADEINGCMMGLVKTDLPDQRISLDRGAKIASHYKVLFENRPLCMLEKNKAFEYSLVLANNKCALVGYYPESKTHDGSFLIVDVNENGDLMMGGDSPDSEILFRYVAQ